MFITAVHANVSTITKKDVVGLHKAYRAFMLSKAMGWATGGIRSLEFGYDGQKKLPWRLHIHILIPITVPFSNIRKVKDEMHATWKKNNVDDLNISVKGGKYIHQHRLKYVGKGNDNPDIPAKQLEQLYLATKGRQLVNKFGSWCP